MSKLFLPKNRFALIIHNYDYKKSSEKTNDLSLKQLNSLPAVTQDL